MFFEIQELNSLFQNTFVALLGAFIGWLIAFLLGLVKKETIKRKNPIAGKYISYFEDEENGQKLTVASKTVLKQKGKDVKGKNWLKGDRSWELEGSILEGRHVAGIYWAESNYDTGVGSFYLNFDGKDMDGIWSGFDFVNKKVSSGRYYFLKEPAFKILPVSKEYWPSVYKIASNVFGEGYLEDEEIADKNRSDYVQCAVKKAVNPKNRDVIGFSWGKVLSEGDLHGYFPEVPFSKDVYFSEKRGALGIIKTIAVVPECQKRGVGGSLLKEIENHLKNKGCDSYIVPAWKDSKGINIEGLLLLNGYEKVYEVDGFWKEGCDQGKFLCPSRRGQCECSAVLFRK